MLDVVSRYHGGATGWRDIGMPIVTKPEIK
jgi:hypothetical protein